MFNDHFTRQLLDGEDLTFEQFQDLKQSQKIDLKLEAEKEKLEKEERREHDFNEMVRLDAEIETLSNERENLKQLRAQITKQYDLRELNLRQEWWDLRREFDAICSKYNAGRPYTASSVQLADELRQKGAKLEALELPILKTQLSPSAQLLWERDFKPKPES
jgi:glycerophosphoryl diester phosphodiesterase